MGMLIPVAQDAFGTPTSRTRHPSQDATFNSSSTPARTKVRLAVFNAFPRVARAHEAL